MELGRHRALIPELRSLVATYPLNEWMHAQLIQALNGSGRRADALRAYQDLRNVLSDELGLDPAPELQRLQQEMLSAGAGPTPLAVARPPFDGSLPRRGAPEDAGAASCRCQPSSGERNISTTAADQLKPAPTPASRHRGRAAARRVRQLAESGDLVAGAEMTDPRP